MRNLKKWGCMICLTVVVLLTNVLPVSAIGDSTLYATTSYVGFVASPGNTYQLDISVKNNGNSIRQVALGLDELPEGYKAYFETNGRIVTDVFLEPESSVFTKLVVMIPKDAAEGEDVVTATFTEGDSVQKISFKLKIEQKSVAEGEGKFSVAFPELTGTSDTTFEFKATYNNDTSSTQSFSLASKSPEGWSVTFKPLYEDKNVASISVDAGGSQVLEVDVKPPANVAAGTYDLAIALISPDETYTADLTTIITGTFDAVITTPDGRLNMDAQAGKTATMPITVMNTGSVELKDVKLTSTCPANWEVTFEPSVVPSIPGGEEAQVMMSVKPTNRAIAGEYEVHALAANEGIKESVALRIAVKTPASWGFLGILIILAICVLLVRMFRKYGRK